MRHVMTLANARTGVTYEVVLGVADSTWIARWRATPSGDPSGRTTAADAYEAFELAARAIEDVDEDVIGTDWSFEAPLPPWLCD